METETQRDRVRDRQTDRQIRQTDKWNNVFHGIPMAYVLKVGGWRGGGVGGAWGGWGGG